MSTSVAISRGEDPYHNRLRALDLIKDEIDVSFAGRKVLVKPNLVTAWKIAWETGAVTNPGVVKAIIDFLNFHYQPKETTVGEAHLTEALGMHIATITTFNSETTKTSP